LIGLPEVHFSIKAFFNLKKKERLSDMDNKIEKLLNAKNHKEKN
jgi:hypothetical protein